MRTDDKVDVGQADSMVGGIIFAGDNRVVFDGNRPAHRIADRHDELVFLQDHLKLDDDTGRRLLCAQPFTRFQGIVEQVCQQCDQMFLRHCQPGQVVDHECHGNILIARRLIFLVQDNVYNRVIGVDIAKLCPQCSGHPDDVRACLLGLPAFDQALDTVELVLVVVQEAPLLFIVLLHDMIQLHLAARALRAKLQPAQRLLFLKDLHDQIKEKDAQNCKSKDSDKNGVSVCGRMLRGERVECHKGDQTQERKRAKPVFGRFYKSAQAAFVVAVKRCHESQNEGFRQVFKRLSGRVCLCKVEKQVKYGYNGSGNAPVNGAEYDRQHQIPGDEYLKINLCDDRQDEDETDRLQEIGRNRGEGNDKPARGKCRDCRMSDPAVFPAPPGYYGLKKQLAAGSVYQAQHETSQ